MPAQTLTALYSFCGQPNCTDGEVPYAGLVQATDGNFYGTTNEGGANGLFGTVFKITPSGTLTTLYSFCSQPNCTDGELPYAGLVQATDGNFYGTTSGGGAVYYDGTVFKITPSGTLTTLYSFCSQPNCTDGTEPSALIQATDGNFYGTTLYGGSNKSCTDAGCGTVFKITPSGTLTTLHSFNGLDGFLGYIAGSAQALVQATDGNFYGTSPLGGNQGCGNGTGGGCGTVFKITPGGTFTQLYSFCSQANCTDGFYPLASLVEGTDGNLYGTTAFGGSGGYCGVSPGGCGTVFKITPSGTLTTLYSFCLQSNCPDGLNVYAGLVQATDGNFYGTTQSGGANYSGTIFQITPRGTLTTLYSFCSQPSCADGGHPLAGLVQATDGNFYGTNSAFGGNCQENGQCGTVFRLSTGLSPLPWQFVPLTPCRVVDTRTPNGEFGGPPLQAGTYRNFPLPQGSCNIPANAAAFSLNVTVVPPPGGILGYLTIWPTGKTQPLVSTMNSPDGRTKANAAVVPAGGGGSVSVYVTDTTNLVLDIDGYFTPVSSSTLAFYSLPPCRVIDTRGSDGALGGPYLNGDQERDFPVLESSCIPSGPNIKAYSMNFTVVPVHSTLGYLTVWPTGETMPVVSTLNNPTGTVVANAAIVPAGSGGKISAYPSNNTQLIADINGYFAAAGQGGLSLYPVVPCRVLDTRQNNGRPFMGQKVVNVVGSPCAPPSSAQAYVFNATVVPPGTMPYLTLWPDGQQQPVVSTLNAYDGFITSNMAIVPTTNGSIDAYAAGLTQLILDISGYFAP
ncbi:MAG: choice-of-anchor tandem repeat GloVer-containing protein [Candidatus Korobacteraceae bacterium]